MTHHLDRAIVSEVIRENSRLARAVFSYLDGSGLPGDDERPLEEAAVPTVGGIVEAVRRLR